MVAFRFCTVSDMACAYHVYPGIEARGFIFGPAIALAIGAKFIPLRKPRKLPGEIFLQMMCPVLCDSLPYFIASCCFYNG